MFRISTLRLRESSPVKRNEELEQYCENETLYLIVGATPMHTILNGITLTVAIKVMP
jgi:hypothetical protein